ncbi:BTB/POZ domain-containing protein KCTD9-like [Hydractinia symbiolongicarpus]|uniref:BTB/POZ domain-containing protein KCTD9-like n=1 Tax=Hydractinia symbiolongicarpus TaxID=13093 RepID=UPI00254B0CAF|nr:BTB/POZ domain-containing protein KCTD9-like [Hydractinia symbiolongicarpus]XP_057305649.1 BTB/POZ domain-containing protein KCTD9-like [Hydractinia symbiolongicarpus]XP_057308287.1 BTB/POZ domain-containing protein KCTD9-like [Hydractinia symbiolongicarpus]XP_057308288.1 BTB/POZ domain-containing protein KCTD9-like [Hydractinia symbiolongicarpus]
MTESRLKLFRNGSNTSGKVIALPVSYDELLKIASATFKEHITTIYLKDGSVISSINLLRDDDTIFASAGESFSDIKSCISHKATLSLNDNVSSSDWITLNVGGKCFTTTRKTLTKYPETMLCRLFCDTENWRSAVDRHGSYLIDRSPEYFEPILNYLRHGVLILNDGVNPRGVLEEARFFGLKPVIEEIESNVMRHEKEQSSVSRSEFMRLLMTTSSAADLRCQGVNLSGADLSYLDLRSINFRHANLSNANLQGASMGGCELLLADLSGACLDDASLEGVQMKRANLEGASLKNCKFETVSSSASFGANLEGANLKGANLEGSQMSNVNIRLAILKGANMQNCVLRDATLAGADLENCNLTGADLQGANLRGANVVGTVFLDIVAPLHMVHLM